MFIQILRKEKYLKRLVRNLIIQVGKHEGSSVQIANYYDKNNNVVAQHLRYPNKDFKWLGNSKNIQLFGQHLWKEGGKCWS